MDGGEQHRWTDLLSDEDLAFIKGFVVASGSLKELAASHGVSYRTVRVRLDRLIEKVRALDTHEAASEFERHLHVLLAGGKIDLATLKSLRAAHERELGATP